MNSNQQSSDTSASLSASINVVGIAGDSAQASVRHVQHNPSASANAMVAGFASANSLNTNQQWSNQLTKTDKLKFQGGYHIYRHSTTTIIINGREVWQDRVKGLRER